MFSFHGNQFSPILNGSALKIISDIFVPRDVFIVVNELPMDWYGYDFWSKELVD